MSGLKIASKLTLPLDVVGEAIGILAKRGAGKTNTAKVLVEEMLDADVQVVVLDPVGVWWGFRSAALARFKITGGTFQTYFSQLKRLELLDESGGAVALTEAGLDYVGHVPAALQTTEELLEMWRGALKAGARTMLDVLVERYPDELTKNELAEAVDMTVTGGTFQTYLSTLRRNGLAHISGAYVRASDTLFLGVAR